MHHGLRLLCIKAIVGTQVFEPGLEILLSKGTVGDIGDELRSMVLKIL